MNTFQRNFYLICITCVGLTACPNQSAEKNAKDKKDSLSLEESVHEEKLKNLHFYFGEPTDIERSDFVIYPVSSRDNGGYKNDEVYSDQKNYSSIVQNWNLLFLNTKDSSYHLLTENENWLIESFFVNNAAVDTEISEYGNNVAYNTDLGNIAGKFIFYKVKKDGADEGKEVGYGDPSYLYCSDRNGNNLIQLSPNYYNLRNWDVLKKSNLLVMKLQVDSNKDKTFDDNDDEILMQLDLNHPTAKPQRLLNTAFEKKLKEMFLKRTQ